MSGSRIRVALIGTRGAPARYGGFETCAEEVATGLAARGFDVTVYCRRDNVPGDPASWRGVTLRYPPHLGGRALGTLSHTFAATFDALRRDFDVLFYFNAANSPAALVARVLGRAPVLLNVDGLEWRRRKWGRLGRSYYRAAAWLAPRVAHRLIADSCEIQRWWERRLDAPSSFVAYGAHVEGAAQPDVLRQYELEPGSYFLVVARLEPENNTDLIVRAFERSEARRRLVVVGDVPYRSEWAARLRETDDPRVVFLGGVYEPGHLRELYCGARAYLHGHEVGGTNPALLRAMGHGACVLALDVPFNGEVLGGAGLLFPRDAGALAGLIERADRDDALVAELGGRARERVERAYRWDAVVDAYAALARRAAAGGFAARVPSDAPMRAQEREPAAT